MKATLDVTEMIESARDPQLRAAELALVEAERAVKEAGDRARESCLHPLVVEYPYYRSDYGPSRQDYRICAGCGFHEGGWGCGYYALRNKEGRVVAKAETRTSKLATEPERVSGWWIIPYSRKEPCDPYVGYPDD